MCVELILCRLGLRERVGGFSNNLSDFLLVFDGPYRRVYDPSAIVRPNFGGTRERPHEIGRP